MIQFGAATAAEVREIVRLLRDDDLGSTRENAEMGTYLTAFQEMSEDPNQLLVVGREGTTVVATLQLTIIPSLGRSATKRAQIECVRVDSAVRGQGIGQKMIAWAIKEAATRGAGMVQMTTDHRRPDALQFYESLGFTNTHRELRLEGHQPSHCSQARGCISCTMFRSGSCSVAMVPPHCSTSGGRSDTAPPSTAAA